jgi:hypothetical protein
MFHSHPFAVSFLDVVHTDVVYTAVVTPRVVSEPSYANFPELHCRVLEYYELVHMQQTLLVALVSAYGLYPSSHLLCVNPSTVIVVSWPSELRHNRILHVRA